jgi:AcrR family transcriptional regulator
MNTRTERKQKTQEQLLTAARKVFTEKGYVRATVADVANEAGKAHGTFYLYFDNKQAVFAKLLDDAIRSLTAQGRDLWQPTRPTYSVWVTVARLIDEYGANRDLWLLLEQMNSVDPVFTEMRDLWRETLSKRILRGFTASTVALPPDIDVNVLADVFASMLDEICWVRYVEGRDWEPAVIALHIATFWARTLGFPPEELDEVRAIVDSQKATG